MIPKKNRRLPLRRFTRRRNVNGNSTRRRTILSRFGRSRSTRRTNYTGRRRTGFKRRRIVSRKSPVTQVLKQLFPINRFTYNTAQQEEVIPGSFQGALSCRWFVPVRALNVSISYPNWTDMLDVAGVIQKGSPSDTLAASGSAFTQGSNDPKFHSMNFRQTCKVVNQSNAQCCLEVYECTARHDVPTFTQGALFQGFNFLNWLGHGFAVSNVNSDVSTGLPTANPDEDMVSAFLNAGALQMTDAALTPFDSPTFVRLFSVKSVPKRILNAGDITTYQMVYKKKFTNKASQYKTLLGPDSTWRYSGNVDELSCVAPKGSKFLLFKLTGQPAHIPGETSTAVNLTTPKVDVVTHVEFQYQYVNPRGNFTYRSSNYGIQQGNQPQTIMNEATATPAAFVNV